MAKLILVIDGVAINEYPLAKQNTSIGRDPNADILVDDPVVSSRHALVTSTENAYLPGVMDFYIEDLGSKNGTDVNGRKVRKLKLHHGDIIRIGRTELRFEKMVDK
jgi:pSer/pThr/pTyr-binding forkhead associated (FHA) protein